MGPVRATEGPPENTGRGDPVHPSENAGTDGESTVRLALDQLPPRNDTETGDETNLRRANNAALQTALELLGAHIFASNEDMMWWQQEFRRQSIARAPRDPRTRRTAA